jgi:PAS domain S-box-containing protein
MGQIDNWKLTEMLHYEHGQGDPFAAAVRATRMPMAITDPSRPDNPLVFVNQAFQELTGYSREECIGRNCRFLQGPRTDPTTIAHVREAVANGENISVDLLNYRKDGSTFWNALYLSPVRGLDGNVLFFFASQLDVSDRVEAQQRMIDQKEIVEHEVSRRTADLEASLEAQTLLLHDVDHRVKNNLSVIGSLIRLQIKDTDDPAVRKALRATMERVDALAAVHRRLYQADDVRFFDVSVFALNLVQDTISGSANKDIYFRSDMQRADLPSEAATSLGLLLNEILHRVLDAPAEVQAVELSCKILPGSLIIMIGSEMRTRVSPLQIPAISQTLMARLSAPIGAHVEWKHTSTSYSVHLTIPRNE